MGTPVYYPFLDIENEMNSINNSTLDIKHEQVIEYYREQKKNLPSLISQLEKKQERLNELNSNSLFDLTEKERLERESLIRETQKLDNQIQSLENEEVETNYFLEVMDHLLNYYDEDNQDCRADIYNKYLTTIDPRYLNYHTQSRREPQYVCPECNESMSLNATLGHSVCLSCGLTEPIILEETRITYSNGIPSQETNCFTYKKITHFNERSQQCQAKERTTIPNEVFDGIKAKIRAERITDPKRINVKKIKLYLKELGYAGYYEHSHFILSRITGKLAPEIPPDVNNKLRNMFKEINVAFKHCCPEGRKNFPSYNYVFYKCIQLIGTCDYLLPHFPLLKSPLKRHNMDEIWKDICKRINWQFIPSD